jgi:pyruvate-formate lyase-activating enzyme
LPAPVRRVARRARWRPPDARPPARPVGVKLELTHACNLRCGFCYTDSPRHTLARTPDLSDDDWLAIVDEAIALGVLEAVITGGEPLLRRDLTLEVIQRLDAAGVGTTLNTNGWFVDDVVADRLAACRGLSVFISLDGATSATHDASRGVPGGWARAVAAMDRLLSRGVPVRIVHVVTPDTQPETEALIELGWQLGVSSVQMTPVVPTGAAARGGDWRIDAPRLRGISDHAGARWPGMPVIMRTGSLGDGMAPTRRTPLGLLVRPSGAVRIESVNPFAFGHARRDGLAGCWDRIVAGFDAPELMAWDRRMGVMGDYAKQDVVPYLDEDVPAERPSTTQAARAAALAAPVPAKSKAREPGPYADVAGALAHGRELGFARAYRSGAVRVSGEHVRVLATGTISRLNSTAAAVLGACSPGKAGDATAALVAAYPAESPDRIERDVRQAIRSLAARAILRPALAQGDAPATAEGTVDLPY